MSGIQPLPDDASIGDDAALWRRIHPTWWVLNSRTGAYEITSQAFQNYPATNSMSVYLAAETSQARVLGGFAGYGLAQLTAGLVRQHGQVVNRAPVQDAPGHAHVEGNKTGRVKNALKAGCTIVWEPVRP